MAEFNRLQLSHAVGAHLLSDTHDLVTACITAPMPPALLRTAVMEQFVPAQGETNSRGQINSWGQV
ncbi:hypothetical protein ACFPOU_19585 [Massilia jejuensis]|uniref:Uncharacterized protein n=1 Tax=Massilia jejuensis TaxID=648894 RepID=A0ABW0PLJ1_9BURK